MKRNINVVILVASLMALTVGCSPKENMTSTHVTAGEVTCIFNKTETCVVKEILPINTNQATLFLKVGLLDSLTGTTDELTYVVVNPSIPTIKVGDHVQVIDVSVYNPRTSHFDYLKLVQGLVTK